MNTAAPQGGWWGAWGTGGPTTGLPAQEKHPYPALGLMAIEGRRRVAVGAQWAWGLTPGFATTQCHMRVRGGWRGLSSGQ